MFFTRRTRTGGGLPAMVFFCALIFVSISSFAAWTDRGFARYAMTSHRWVHAQGTVISQSPTTQPDVRFSTIAGTPQIFNEDYNLICGRSNLCKVCNFQPGQVVPIVYDPVAPNWAFVDDWALHSSALSMVLWVGFVLFAVYGLVKTIGGFAGMAARR